MNVITAKNVKALPPSGEWMSKLKASMERFAGPGHPVNAVFYDDNWAGRQSWHCIYSVGLKTIIDVKNLDQVNRPLCWRFIAGGYKSLPTAEGCWMTHELNGIPARVMAMSQSREMAEILADAECLNQLSHISGHPADQYELRILRIPGLNLEAFWLKGNSDWIVPYGLILEGIDRVKLGAGQTLEKNKAYGVSEFLKLTHDVASKRLKAEETMPR